MKTAVEYLEEEIKISNKDTFYDLVECIELAKERERKQMIDLVKYILKEVDFNEPQVPYELVDLYLIADDRKQKSEVELCGRCNGVGQVMNDNGAKMVNCRYCT